MTDLKLKTVETVTIENRFKVRVGECYDGSYQAVVDKYRPTNPVAQGLAGIANDTSWIDASKATAVRATGKYSAVGNAVENFLNARRDDE